jgi:Domain of unknown function (DUF4190)
VSYQPPDEPAPPPGGYLDDRSSAGYGQMPLPPPGDPYGPPPGYPQYGQYGYAPQYPPSRNTNGMAIASLVCGVLGFSTCGVTSILAIIFGHVSLGQIRRNDEDGRGMAIAGLVLGYVAVAIGLIVIAVVVIVANTTD